MPRILNDWLTTYLRYTTGTEPPPHIHFWCGVSAIAGALRKHVWIDMKRFKWVPNFYIIVVGPPGVISKTTTMDLSMDLLREVPGVRFGPDVVTWQALVKMYAEGGEMFQYGEDWIPMSALTLASGELGDLIKPKDPDMMSLYITLYDARKGLDKVTKTSGSESVNSPYLNLIGCTTPDWLAENMPQAAIGGGFTSRCIFVYGDEKRTPIAYPDEVTFEEDYYEIQRKLRADLEHIATNLIGPFRLTPEARDWGKEWYIKTWGAGRIEADDPLMRNYMARKQTHMHKLAMVLSASGRDDLVIERDHLVLAHDMLGEVEKGFHRVFAQVGRTDESLHAERLLEFIRRKKRVTWAEAYQFIHLALPSAKAFQEILTGLQQSGRVQVAGNSWRDAVVVYCGGVPPRESGGVS